MVLGMSLSTFTMLHVVICLLALGAGFAVLRDMLRSVDKKGSAIVFLVLSFLISVTGFLFPFSQLLPGHIIGIILLAVLTVALAAHDLFKLKGIWRPVYVIAMVAGFYLNAFVTVFQMFLKIGALHDLAPTGSEPPFAAAQGVLLIAFGVAGTRAVKNSIRRWHKTLEQPRP